MGTYLGQNFLIDAKVRSYIADKISALYKNLGCEALLEIGPGKGSITKLIQHISEHFFVVDKDPTFHDNGQLAIDHGAFILSDILELDVDVLLKEKKLSPEKTLIIGNLPYYITSPILRKFFGEGKQDFAGGIFMVQDEVGEKIRHDAKKKSYLRRLLNFAYTVTYMKGVPAKCFKPAPKVKSCLIQLTANPAANDGTGNEQLPIDWNRFIEFLELFAPFSRKTLGAIQKMIKKKSDRIFEIPVPLQKKRLEELDRKNIETILMK